MGTRLLPPLAAFLFLGLAIALAPFFAVRAQTSPAYLALGDSLAYGVGATDPAAQGYVPLIAGALRQSGRYGAVGLDVVNLGAPGAQSADLVAAGGQLERALQVIADRRASNGPGVEIISLDVGGNDLLALATRDSPCFAEAAGDVCRQQLGQMLSSLQRDLGRALRELRQAAPNAAVYVLDLYNPYSGAGDPREVIADIAVQQVNGVIAAVVADPQLNVRPARVYELFQGHGQQWIAADGIHPNDSGHAVIAEVFLAAIEGRPVAIPDRLLGPSAGAAGQRSGAGSGGDDTTLLLAIAVPLSFLAGALVSGAYFFARGRS